MAEPNPEIEQTETFGEAVARTQKRWRETKSPALKEFSQAVDIPEKISANIVNLMVDSMPDFIPDDVRQKIKQEHPVPTIAAGFLPDKRGFGEEYTSTYELPSWLSKEDEEDFQNGLVLINEIATDTLANDIEENISKKNVWFRLTKGITEVRKKFLSPPIQKSIGKSEKLLGGREKFEEFRQNLILGMLTGDRSQVDAQLSENGFGDLDRFALEIGREAKYAKSIEWLTKIIKRERLAMIISGGHVDVRYPGIVNLHLGYASPVVANIGAVALEGTLFATGFYMGFPTMAMLMAGVTAMNGAFALFFSNTIQHTITHEMSHYLSQDVNRVGLLKYKISSK